MSAGFGNEDDSGPLCECDGGHWADTCPYRGLETECPTCSSRDHGSRYWGESDIPCPDAWHYKAVSSEERKA